MAISAPHYRCLKELHRRGELPQGGSILEIGEANWYGDIEPPYPGDAFEVVKALYADLFGARQTIAVDFDGSVSSLPLDLNSPIDIRPPFRTVINHGTAEHIFNIGQVFRTIHDHCAVGGLMIHESPFTGWVDHGFYCLQPTLFWDLANANGYQMVFMAVEQIAGAIVIEIHNREQLHQMAAAGCLPHNAMLYVAMRKTQDEEFKIPMQGVYAGTAGNGAAKAWKELR